MEQKMEQKLENEMEIPFPSRSGFRKYRDTLGLYTREPQSEPNSTELYRCGVPEA